MDFIIVSETTRKFNEWEKLLLYAELNKVMISSHVAAEGIGFAQSAP